MTATRKTTPRNARKNATTEAIDVDIKNMEQQLHMDSETFWERLGFRPYSVQTTITKLIARVAMYALGVTAALYVTSMLSAVMLAAGWPMFLVAVVELFTLIMAVIGSWVISDKVVDFVASGGITRSLKNTGSWLTTKFGDGSTFLKARMSMH